jgi:hypothetical protein
METASPISAFSSRSKFICFEFSSISMMKAGLSLFAEKVRLHRLGEKLLIGSHEAARISIATTASIVTRGLASTSFSMHFFSLETSRTKPVAIRPIRCVEILRLFYGGRARRYIFPSSRSPSTRNELHFRV